MTKTQILEKCAPSMDNVLQILHDFQNHNPRNYLPEKDLALIAAYLKTTYATIYGIVSYYSMFSLKPRGKHIIRICRSPVCDLTGVGGLFQDLNRLLSIGVGETTPDGFFTLETSECIGHCDRAPAMMVGETVYGHLNSTKIEAIIRKYREKRGRSRRKPK